MAATSVPGLIEVASFFPSEERDTFERLVSALNFVLVCSSSLSLVPSSSPPLLSHLYVLRRLT